MLVCCLWPFDHGHMPTVSPTVSCCYPNGQLHRLKPHPCTDIEYHQNFRIRGHTDTNQQPQQVVRVTSNAPPSSQAKAIPSLQRARAGIGQCTLGKRRPCLLNATTRHHQQSYAVPPSGARTASATQIRHRGLCAWMETTVCQSFTLQSPTKPLRR